MSSREVRIVLPGEDLDLEASPGSADAYTYVCEMCGRRFTYEASSPPMCTGPNDQDDHPGVVMTMVWCSIQSRAERIRFLT